MTYAHELHGVDIMHGKIEGNKEASYVFCEHDGIYIKKQKSKKSKGKKKINKKLIKYMYENLEDWIIFTKCN